MTRDEFILQQVNKSLFGLEIGPGYAPTFPRSKNWNVETLDHATADELREKYRGITDISSIEEINYVSDARPIHEIIDRRGAYDFIYASHVLEHLTDPVSFFRSCEMLLKKDGKLILVIPDKRRCFDALQSVTSTGDFHLLNSFAQARDAYHRSLTASEYIDIHAWRFTPTSFRLIMQDLYNLNLICLREITMIPTTGMEFYFSASINAAGCMIDRLALLKEILHEQIEGFTQVINPLLATPPIGKDHN